jgi:hypothetical protein
LANEAELMAIVLPLAAEEKATDPSNPDVVTKYRKAGDITNAALQLVIKVLKSRSLRFGTT